MCAKKNINGEFFSIIVPVYNSEKCIRNCITSILAQSYPNYELILIDDGSTDASGDICDSYAVKDFRVKVIHQKNKGVSQARNAGLHVCNGSRICFVDSDDEVKSDWLEHYARNADADMLVQGMLFIYPNGERKSCSMPDRLIIDDDRLNLDAEKYNLFSPIKCFKTDIIRRNNLCFVDKMHLAEDCVFVLNYMTVSDSIHFIPYDGYVYHIEFSTLIRRIYDSVTILKWNETLLVTTLRTCKGNKSEQLYLSIQGHQFCYISWYLVKNFGQFSIEERQRLYDVLRSIYPILNFKNLKKRYSVFMLLPLPNILFDMIVRGCAALYLLMNSIVKLR